MRVFVFEYLTGGGMLSQPAFGFEPSLLREGRAMLSAILTDLSALSQVEVTILHDERLGGFEFPASNVISVGSAAQWGQAFSAASAAADWSIIIAPEFDGILLDCCQRVVAAGGRLLGPPPELVALCANKHHTAQWLAARGIPVPRGQIVAPGDALPAIFPCPAILKPIDGAGSQNITFVPNQAFGHALPSRTSTQRLEQFWPGEPASVSILAGPQACFSLAACRQWLTDDGTFRYLGGSLPLPSSLASRAIRLGLSVAEAVSHRLGYIGMDLVLGEDPAGAGDAVIEVNPRLTTSYVGLRAACSSNLASCMVALAEGKHLQPTFEDVALRFDADGSVNFLGCSEEPRL